jgi:hypothetical protein
MLDVREHASAFRLDQRQKSQPAFFELVPGRAF